MSPEPEPPSAFSFSLSLTIAPSVSLAISLFVCSQRQANWNNPEKYCWLWFGAAFCFGFTHRFFCSISVYFVLFFPSQLQLHSPLNMTWHLCMHDTQHRPAGSGRANELAKKTSERKLTAHHLHPTPSPYGRASQTPRRPSAHPPIRPYPVPACGVVHKQFY